MVVYCEGVPPVVVFEISPSLMKTFHCPQRQQPSTPTHTLCDVSVLALLNPKTSRFVGQVTSYRRRVRFRRPLGLYLITIKIHYGFNKPNDRSSLTTLKLRNFPCSCYAYQHSQVQDEGSLQTSLFLVHKALLESHCWYAHLFATPSPSLSSTSRSTAWACLFHVRAAPSAQLLGASLFAALGAVVTLGSLDGVLAY